MSTDCAAPDVVVETASEEEVWTIFDRQAHRLLGMSGEDFFESWHRGKFADDEDSRVTRVAMLMPSAW